MTDFERHDWRDNSFRGLGDPGGRGRRHGGRGMTDSSQPSRGRGGPGGGSFRRRSGGGPGGGGMHRAARGNVRAAILALLADQAARGGPPIHGYQMIQELSARTGGAWRPSPGSIYPTLQLLEDEGLVSSSAPEGKRLFELTEAGQAEFEHSRESRAPWDQVSDGFGESRLQLKIALRETIKQLFWAAKHATEDQQAGIQSLLGELREKLTALFPDGLDVDEPGEFHGRGHGRRGGRPGGEGGRHRPAGRDETFDV